MQIVDGHLIVQTIWSHPRLGHLSSNIAVTDRDLSFREDIKVGGAGLTMGNKGFGSSYAGMILLQIIWDQRPGVSDLSSPQAPITAWARPPNASCRCRDAFETELYAQKGRDLCNQGRLSYPNVSPFATDWGRSWLKEDRFCSYSTPSFSMMFSACSRKFPRAQPPFQKVS